MTVTFTLQIAIEAATPEAAYDLLCDALDPTSDALSYQTETYSTDEDPAPRDTYFLWPDNREEAQS